MGVDFVRAPALLLHAGQERMHMRHEAGIVLFVRPNVVF
jgi:hypothetical protein